MALTIDQLNIQIEADSKQATTAIDNLAASLNRLKSSLGSLSSPAKKTETSLKGVGTSAKKGADGLGKFDNKTKSATRNTKSFSDKLAQNISKWSTLTGAFKRYADMFAGWFTESNDYIETLNLFNVTMGEGAEAASKYAEKVSELMGIDIAEWMNYQGTFKQLTSGFGVAEEAANTMSQNLTQLSYDLASFFNTDVETAFDKLSSAMSGQVKGLREFGIDTTVASLQEYALSKGIDASVRSMTQAEKSLLRYNYIMEKSTLIQGDMARTIITPSNALRILNAQLTQMKRALGNVVSVLVTQFIPYVQVMVEMIADAANALANFFGFTLPEIDYSGLDTGGFAEDMEDAEDALGGAADTLKEIKKQLMGFDELNIINNPESDASSGGAVGVPGGALGGREPLEYDFLAGLKTDKLDEIKETLKKILDDALAIGAAIMGWKLLNFAKEIEELHPKISGLLKFTAGITIAVSGFALEFSGAKEIGNGTAGLGDYIKTAFGAGLGIAGSLIAFGTGPLGWTIGIASALAVFIAGFSVGYEERKLREDLEKRFGEIALSVEEIKEQSEKLTTSDLSLKLDLYVDEVATLESLKTQVESSLKQLQSYNFKIKLGVEVSKDSYMVAMDQYVLDATEYLTQKQVTASLAIEILYDNNETGKRLTSFVSSFYGDNQAKLTDLGNKLKNTIETGFVDGEWIEGKHEEAIKLQKEIQEILEYVSEVEFKAKLKSIELDIKNLDMNSESFVGILEQAQSTIEEQVAALEGVRLESLKVAQMEYDQNILNGMSKDAAQQILDSAVNEAQEKFEEAKLELNFNTVDFGLGVIHEKYKAEVETIQPLFAESTTKLFMMGGMATLPEETYEDIGNLVMQMRDAVGTEIANMDISSEARTNISNLVSQLQPSITDLEEIAESAKTAGRTVPEYVSKGLHDANMLKAVDNDARAIAYLVGEKLSTDTAFLDTLATAEGAGKAIDEETANGLTNNLKVVEDAANGTVTLINDAIGEKTLEVTPELIQNMQDLGINLSDGLLLGAMSKQAENEKGWKSWAIWPWNWFKKANEINSPSKLFEGGGKNIIQGLRNGMESGWSSLSGWWSKLSLSTPSIKMPHFEWSSAPASGWIASTLGALGLPLNLPKLNVSWYAQGGFPSMGEMFIARERGPELVGQIGNKTAVTNNDQIISGIEAGVYRAMMAAGGSGGTQTIRIINEIDGDVVGEKVIQYHNGKVMQTGASPLLV